MKQEIIKEFRELWEKQFGKTTLLGFWRENMESFLSSSLDKVEREAYERGIRKAIDTLTLNRGESITEFTVDGIIYHIDKLPQSKSIKEVSVNCIRCNDNGCPSCDGIKGSKYNPEPF